MDNAHFHESLKPLRTEEVEHIIDKMPARFGLNITFISLFLILSALLFGWFIKYPDILPSDITLTGKTSPIKIIALSNGKIDLFLKKTSSIVMENQPIAIVKNTANYYDIVRLDSLLKKIDLNQLSISKHRNFFPTNLVIGELTPKYFSFYNALLQYIDYSDKEPFSKQSKVAESLFKSKKVLDNENDAELQRLKTKYDISKRIHQRDSLLFEKKIISALDLEKSKLYSISSEQEYKLINREFANNDYLLIEAKTRLEQIAIQKRDKERELKVVLYNSYYSLIDGIQDWQKKYLMKSPFNGIVEFLYFSKNDDFVQQGQEMFSVIPEKNELIGQAFLPDWGSGKVKVGQDVIIKLHNYPYIQYGSVRGKVKSISLISNQQITDAKTNIGAYLVQVDLPNGLTTNFGSKLNFQFEMKGVAEIITEDKRLIERLFDNLKYRIK